MKFTHRSRSSLSSALTLIGLICLSQVGCHAELQLPKPSEHDVLASLFASPWLPESEFTLMSVVSGCEMGTENTSGLPLLLHEAYLLANATDSTPIDLRQFTFRESIDIESRDLEPSRVRISTRSPVITVARVGILQDQAVVCVQIYAKNPVAYFVTLDRVDATRWRLANQFVAWKPDEELTPEEFADDPL